MTNRFLSADQRLGELLNISLEHSSDLRQQRIDIDENSAKTGLTSGQEVKLAYITVSTPVNLSTIDSNVITNNAKPELIDEDSFASNDPTKAPSQQSVRTYVLAKTDAVATNTSDITAIGNGLTAVEAKTDFITVGSNINLDTTTTNISTNASDIATNTSTISTLQVKPSEGAFADGDKTKLDSIETNADITDVTNVTAAGALMDSEMTDLAGVKAMTVSDYATNDATASAFLSLITSYDLADNQTKLTAQSYASGATTIGTASTKLIIDDNTAIDTPSLTFQSQGFVLFKGADSSTKYDMILDRGDNYWSAFTNSRDWDCYISATKYDRNATGATMFLQYYSHGDINMCGQGGKVGIGGGSSYPLQVYGYSATPNASYRGIRYSDWWVFSIAGGGSAGQGDMGIRSDYDLDGINDGSGTIYTSAKFQYAIQAMSMLITSDRRIKENIREVNDGSSLQKLRDLPCVKYEYIDKMGKGFGTSIGFIAQDVKEHIPLACSLSKEFIPNELRVIEPVWETITDLSGNETFKLTISDLDVSGNTKYRFLCSSGDEGKDVDLENLAEEPKSFIFEKKWEKIFLYGKEVDDFHKIDKQKIFAIAFSATQEIDRIQQQHAIQIAALEARLTALENK